MQNKQGQQIPQITFRVREDDRWVNLTSDQLFPGKNIVLFSLPGAFTPTCSSTHLPRYNALATTFQKEGIDEILCVSVNDSFVMNSWKAQQEANNIRMLPDGNGEFTEAMGMLVDKKNLGFGMRSWRYSMLVRDGVIEKMFIEPDEPGDPFVVSDADTMLAYLNRHAVKPESMALFTKPGCGHCAIAKELLAQRNIQFEEIVLGRDATSVSLRAICGRESVPQLFIEGRHIGGADDVKSYFYELESKVA